MNGTKRQWVSARRQAGMTTLGLIILVIFVGLFVFAGIRLTPVYLNYMKVAGVVTGVHKEFDGQKASTAAVRKSIQRRLNVETIGEISWQDFKVSQVDGGIQLAVDYDHTTPFIANLSFRYISTRRY